MTSLLSFTSFPHPSPVRQVLLFTSNLALYPLLSSLISFHLPLSHIPLATLSTAISPLLFSLPFFVIFFSLSYPSLPYHSLKCFSLSTFHSLCLLILVLSFSSHLCSLSLSLSLSISVSLGAELRLDHSIKQLFPNGSGTRLVVVDNSGGVHLFNPVTGTCELGIGLGLGLLQLLASNNPPSCTLMNWHSLPGIGVKGTKRLCTPLIDNTSPCARTLL